MSTHEATPAAALRNSPRARHAAPGATWLARIVVGLVLPVALLPGRTPAQEKGKQDLRAEVETLARENAVLEKRVELANGKEFYLLLDPGAGRLRLMVEGAVLRDYAVQGIEAGSPRVALRSRGLERGWVGRIWSQGNLDPSRDRERTEIQIPDSTKAVADSAPAAFKMPPLPEEIYPVPHRYHVRYADGLSLEVRPVELDASAGVGKRLHSGLRVWWHDFRAALARQPADVVRLRLIMAPQDAASLYRALPPDTRLFVLPRS